MKFARTFSPPPPVSTPYQRAKAKYDERFGEPRVRERRWRLFAFGVLGFAVVVSGASTYAWLYSVRLLARKQPIYVTVDSAGGATLVPPAALDYTPSDLNVRFRLDRFIRSLRTVSSDPKITNAMWLEASTTCARKCASFVRQYFDEFGGLTKRAERQTRNVEIISIVKQKQEGIWQIDWKERAWERSSGDILEQSSWRALVRVAVQAPVTEAELLSNPLGVWVVELNWDRVMAP